MSGVATPEIHRAIDAICRIEAPKLTAGLTRMVRDVGTAEDLAHDALVVAICCLRARDTDTSGTGL